MSAILAMGGYGAYIWSAYGISALGIGIAVLLTIKGLRDAGARVKALEARTPGSGP